MDVWNVSEILLIIENDDRMFITSDNPVVRYNYMYMKRNYYRGYGLGNMGIQLFMPMSPKICLYLFDDIMYLTKLSGEGNIILKDEKTVDRLNKLFYLNSYKYLFFLECGHEHYIKKLAVLSKTKNKEPNSITVFGSKDSKIIIDQDTFVKEKIDLSFVKLNPSLEKMTLPAHAGGPIRPYVDEIEDAIKKKYGIED